MTRISAPSYQLLFNLRYLYVNVNSFSNLETINFALLLKEKLMVCVFSYIIILTHNPSNITNSG